jgi:hypothetical protein
MVMTERATAALSRRAARVQPPADALAFLPGQNYADAFSVADPPPASARTWAERCLAGEPEWQHRVFGTLVWHGVLGFDLAQPGTDGTMVGWRIAVDEPELFVLKTDGRLMAGCMVFAIDGRSVTWTTALEYHSTRAKTIWSGAQHAHRMLAGRLLGRAAHAIARTA